MRPTSPRIAALPTFTMADWNTTLLHAGHQFAQSMHRVDEVFFIQVGAMDGKSFDPVYPHQRKHKGPARAGEPLEDHFASLQKNYADVPQMRFERAAIAPHNGTVTMRRIDPQAVASGA